MLSAGEESDGQTALSSALDWMGVEGGTLVHVEDSQTLQVLNLDMWVIDCVSLVPSGGGKQS